MQLMSAGYMRFYGNEYFVSVLSSGQHPDARHVRSNRCHLGLFIKDRRLVVQSAIDNLGKGAAGQAVQCFNLMAGLPEITGLEGTAVFPDVRSLTYLRSSLSCMLSFWS